MVLGSSRIFLGVVLAGGSEHAHGYMVGEWQGGIRGYLMGRLRQRHERHDGLGLDRGTGEGMGEHVRGGGAADHSAYRVLYCIPCYR